MDRLGEHLEAYRYNRWANERTFDTVAALPEEPFRRDLGSSFPSVQRTLVHILAAEWIWLRRWKGTSPADMPADWQTLDLNGIRAEWSRVDEERNGWLRSLSTADLDRTIAYSNIEGEPFERPLWQMLRHVVNHSTYHRGQITTLLRQLGTPATTTDFIYFFDPPS